VVGLAGQIPGGALVDAARSERRVVAFGVAAISTSALAIAAWPIFPIVLLAKVLHSAASCVVGPAIAAISLGLVGHAKIGERLGRNARFAAIGNGVAAAAMGACGYFVSSRAVFVLTALLLLPTLWALRRIRDSEIDVAGAHGGMSEPTAGLSLKGLRHMAHNRALFMLAVCTFLFHLANAAMLPLVAGIVTTQTSQWAPVLIAACIVGPQLVVAATAAWVGRQAQLRGRRPLLLLGFGAVAVRGLLIAMTANPYLLVAIQLLDGVSGAVLGVMVPLVVADVTRGSGRFNLAQGLVGSAVGIGGAFSTTLAGYLTDHLGSVVAFCGLAGVAAVGFAVIATLMPETRPAD